MIPVAEQPHPTSRRTVIRIITIEREYGCGAAAIARELAKRLGWKLWDQLLTQEIAQFAHCEQSQIKRREERTDPLYYRLLCVFRRCEWSIPARCEW
jgi:predicted double-glycine peptidase